MADRYSVWRWMLVALLAGVVFDSTDVSAEPPARAAQANAAPVLGFTETDEQLSITFGDQLLLAYNKKSPPVPEGIKPIYHRSGFLHPVNTPAGKTITATFPYDHAHQHGIFTAWSKATYDGAQVDFWNLFKGQGRVLHESVKMLPVATPADSKPPTSLSFQVTLLHRIVAKEPSVDVLRETWNVTVSQPNEAGYMIDLDLKQEALTSLPLICEKYHYGGVAVRGVTDWLIPKEANAKPAGGSEEPSTFLNNAGSDRLKGNHEPARWVAMSGKLAGDPAYIAALSHAKNFRAPQPARLHPTMPYFCFSPCVTEAFVIDKEHPFVGRYRFVVADGEPDSEALNHVWKAWCDQDE